MGGYGSGRRWGSHDTTNDKLRMDVCFMQRKGFLRVGCSGSLHWTRRGERFAAISFETHDESLLLYYRCRETGSDWESLQYSVPLERTPCHFGGTRTWFACPVKGCARRTGTLYGGRIFACRQCHQLRYLSQRENQSDRAADRALNILKKLQCDGFMCVLDSDPPRPKGMHRTTHKRLAALYEMARYETCFYGPPGAMALYYEG